MLKTFKVMGTWLSRVGRMAHSHALDSPKAINFNPGAVEIFFLGAPLGDTNNTGDFYNLGWNPDTLRGNNLDIAA